MKIYVLWTMYQNDFKGNEKYKILGITTTQVADRIWSKYKAGDSKCEEIINPTTSTFIAGDCWNTTPLSQHQLLKITRKESKKYYESIGVI